MSGTVKRLGDYRPPGLGPKPVPVDIPPEPQAEAPVPDAYLKAVNRLIGYFELDETRWRREPKERAARVRKWAKILHAAKVQPEEMLALGEVVEFGRQAGDGPPKPADVIEARRRLYCRDPRARDAGLCDQLRPGVAAAVKTRLDGDKLALAAPKGDE